MKFENIIIMNNNKFFLLNTNINKINKYIFKPNNNKISYNSQVHARRQRYVSFEIFNNYQTIISIFVCCIV